jgi:hypothetical protein
MKGSPPNLPNQPVLVIEVPRELCNENTTNKYFAQATSSLDLGKVVSPSRWKYIGKFLLVYTNREQVNVQY